MSSFAKINKTMDLILTTGKEESVQLLLPLITNLENEIAKLDQIHSRQYMVYLAELYAFKIRDFKKAEALLLEIRQRNDKHIGLQCELRLSYFSFIQGKIKEASEHLENAVALTRSKHSLKESALSFLIRMVNPDAEDQSSKTLFARGIDCQLKKDIPNATAAYLAIYQRPDDEECKYQAAMSILRLNQLPKQSIDLKRFAADYEESATIVLRCEERSQYLLSVIRFLRELQRDHDDSIIHPLLKIILVAKLRSAAKHVGDKEVKSLFRETVSKICNQEMQGRESAQLYYQHCIIEYRVMREAQKVIDAMWNAKYKLKIGFTAIQELEREPSMRHAKFSKTFSEDILQDSPKKSKRIDNFQGSMMTKVHIDSSGYVKRYFFIKSNFQENPKLFYCAKKDQAKDVSDAYSLKSLYKISQGKDSEAFQRKECDEFEEQLCLTLKCKSAQEKDLNLYVEQKRDYDMWLGVFEKLVGRAKELKASKMSKSTKRGVKFE